MLDAVKTIMKTGKESFIFNGDSLPINELAYEYSGGKKLSWCR